MLYFLSLSLSVALVLSLAPKVPDSRVANRSGNKRHGILTATCIVLYPNTYQLTNLLEHYPSVIKRFYPLNIFYAKVDITTWKIWLWNCSKIILETTFSKIYCKVPPNFCRLNFIHSKTKTSHKWKSFVIQYFILLLVQCFTSSTFFYQTWLISQKRKVNKKKWNEKIQLHHVNNCLVHDLN